MTSDVQNILENGARVHRRVSWAVWLGISVGCLAGVRVLHGLLAFH